MLRHEPTQALSAYGFLSRELGGSSKGLNKPPTALGLAAARPRRLFLLAVPTNWYCSACDAGDCRCMKLRSFLHAAVRFRFFTNDGLSCDINEPAFADHTFAVIFLQLLGCCVENNNFMPDGVIFGVYSKRKPGDLLITI